MEEFETLDGIIKIKEIIPLNTWEFPIATSVRIKTIKKVLKKEIPPKGIIHIIFRTISGNPRQFNYRDESVELCISAHGNNIIIP